MKIVWNKFTILWELSRKLKKEKLTKQFVCLISTKETKEIRTAWQNRTFYKLFTDIWNHLGEHKDDVHDMLLGWVFWTKQVTIGRITREVNIEKHTSKLDKEKGKRFIDTILDFCKRENMPITITSRELQSLYESYN